jgi:hypothetical protein
MVSNFLGAGQDERATLMVAHGLDHEEAWCGEQRALVVDAWGPSGIPPSAEARAHPGSSWPPPPGQSFARCLDASSMGPADAALLDFDARSGRLLFLDRRSNANEAHLAVHQLGAASTVALESDAKIVSSGVAWVEARFGGGGRWVVGKTKRGEDAAFVWDAATGKRVQRLGVKVGSSSGAAPSWGVERVAVAPRGDRIALQDFSHFAVHALPSGELLKEFALPDMAVVEDLRFADDDHLVITNGSRIDLLGLDGARLASTMAGEVPIERATPSPDGTFAVAMDNRGGKLPWWNQQGALRVFDLRTGSCGRRWSTSKTARASS